LSWRVALRITRESHLAGWFESIRRTKTQKPVGRASGFLHVTNHQLSMGG